MQRLPLTVADARVVAAWRLPDDLYLSEYGAVRVGSHLTFGLQFDAAGDAPPRDVRGSFGVIDLDTGRLRLLPAVLPGGWTSIMTGFDGYLIRSESRPARGACTFGPDRCTEWLVAVTPAALSLIHI